MVWAFGVMYIHTSYNAVLGSLELSYFVRYLLCTS
jgi:hypothetical protein